MRISIYSLYCYVVCISFASNVIILMELDNSDIFPFIRYFPKLIINDTEFTLFKGEKKYINNMQWLVHLNGIFTKKKYRKKYEKLYNSLFIILSIVNHGVLILSLRLDFLFFSIAFVNDWVHCNSKARSFRFNFIYYTIHAIFDYFIFSSFVFILFWSCFFFPQIKICSHSMFITCRRKRQKKKQKNNEKKSKQNEQITMNA